ncbi:CoA transferase [Rhodovastum atsumiense]|uniref:CoA transferase n=1 Tax=Rhodovastum atsumiense TaxID=504468 RepID=A0A5M6INT8_9PROT|nr:CaiB/BaiF CoA-transferase family protein [Rhodovastum atsumiense]KAA5609920.1 CoA transferase [Rhodovastum atsumiense]CAH2604537.1 CoA transferase [Rhodovastum atsumiense]
MACSAPDPRPLAGLRVLDFSTLLPGPLATLILAEAGAEVVKIERPGTGDEMRLFPPQMPGGSAVFALLNRGKRSLCLDLKAPETRERLLPLLAGADVLVEQFRPGVMARLGLGYEALSALNPGLIYCSITGYGQTGPNAQKAAHDINWMAESGLLSLVADGDGAPVLPPALVGDIGGGAYPAVINILLALQVRARSGRGCHLDVSMQDGLWTFAYAALAEGFGTGRFPAASELLTHGGSPRYRIYRTADGRYLAAAPLEDRFWREFCAIVEVAETAGGTEIAARIASRDSAEWQRRFAGRDVCCSLVASIEEATRDPHFAARAVFAHRLRHGAAELPALPVPVDPGFRAPPGLLDSPALAEDRADQAVVPWQAPRTIPG